MLTVRCLSLYTARLEMALVRQTLWLCDLHGIAMQRAFAYAQTSLIVSVLLHIGLHVFLYQPFPLQLFMWSLWDQLEARKTNNTS